MDLMGTREKRRNYWPSLVVTMIWWLVVVVMVLLVDPVVVADFPLPHSYGIFFLFLFLASLFTASLLLVNTRRGFLVAMGVLILGYLRLWRVLNLFNLVVLIGALIAFEFYFTGGKRRESESNIDSEA